MTIICFYQAGHLKVEHSTLLKGLTDMNQKYDEAAVNNRILKADIETLRAKVCYFYSDNYYVSGGTIHLQ